MVHRQLVYKPSIRSFRNQLKILVLRETIPGKFALPLTSFYPIKFGLKVPLSTASQKKIYQGLIWNTHLLALMLKKLQHILIYSNGNTFLKLLYIGIWHPFHFRKIVFFFHKPSSNFFRSFFVSVLALIKRMTSSRSR